MSRERIRELETLYDIWTEHLEKLEEEIQRLKHEDNEAELTEWAQSHGLQRDQLKAIPCTKVIQDYVYRNWPADSPNKAFYEGSTCEARFTVHEDLYCKAPRPFSSGHDEGQISASLILEALKQKEGD